MKISFRTVFICAAIAATVWVGALFGARNEMPRFQSLADICADIADFGRAKEYVLEKWPVIRGLFEKMRNFLD